MKTQTIEIVKETFEEISDIVTPTMGPKGRMAIIADEFSRPYLTDDGVTVAKECLHMTDPFKKMVATSMIEASNNTEKHAFDGTTLTILLTNEFYKAGIELIEKKKMHPQVAADEIKLATEKALRLLKDHKIDIKGHSDMIKDVANITTKIPMIGELVSQAYAYAGNAMNVIIEHDREHEKSSIEHIDGMVIDSGYFSESLAQLCDEDKKWIAEDAKLFLLSEGILTTNGLKKLFASLEDLSTPLVFFVDKNFNPDALKSLMDNLISNKLRFMIVFINDTNPEEVFLDIAAKTGGKIQSPTLGTTDYLYEFAGNAKKIIVEQDKTTIISTGDKKEIERRVKAYEKELEKNEFTTGYVRADVLTRRMSNLTTGLTKIKIATPSITEYRTIRFKLDDAIGAVRCAIKDGVVLGGGKTLYLIADSIPEIAKALKSPTETIIKNAGYKMPSQFILKNKDVGLDVKTGDTIALRSRGIIDRYTSIESAIKNASSIATSYLRAYILINKEA